MCNKKKVDVDPSMFNKENVREKVTPTRLEEDFQSSCARVSVLKSYRLKGDGDLNCSLQLLLSQVMPYLKEEGKEDSSDHPEESVTEECVVDNSYLCQFCGASFVSYFELKTHRKVHKDEKVWLPFLSDDDGIMKILSKLK